MNNFVIDTPDNFWQIRWLDKYMEGHISIRGMVTICVGRQKKLLQALKGVNVEEEGVFLYADGGWD